MGTIAIVPKEGTASDRLYVISYDEDQWFRYDEEGWQFCYDTWIRKAEPLAVDAVALRLIPDPIFPRGEKERPYIIWQHWFDRKPKKPFKVHAFVQIQLDTRDSSMSVPLRAAVERELSQYPNGTKYEVLNGLNNTVLSGKVSK